MKRRFTHLFWQLILRCSWNPDAIVFNSSHQYGTPSYWVQKFFAESSGATLLNASLQTNSTSLIASAIAWQNAEEKEKSYLRIKVFSIPIYLVLITSLHCYHLRIHVACHIGWSRMRLSFWRPFIVKKVLCAFSQNKNYNERKSEERKTYLGEIERLNQTWVWASVAHYPPYRCLILCLWQIVNFGGSTINLGISVDGLEPRSGGFSESNMTLLTSNNVMDENSLQNPNKVYIYI